MICATEQGYEPYLALGNVLGPNLKANGHSLLLPVVVFPTSSVVAATINISSASQANQTPAFSACLAFFCGDSQARSRQASRAGLACLRIKVLT